MNKLLPVVMSGGSGTRLWPLSRKAYPKQFLDFGAEATLFQQTCQRITDPLYTAPVVICNAEHRFIVAEQLRAVDLAADNIVLEPVSRNTAPTALIAALLAERNDPDSLVLLLASDHVINDHAAFNASVKAGSDAAAAGSIVVFGVKPTRPETGYGYIRTQPGAGAVLDIDRFVEKPEIADAQHFLAESEYFWNAGVFLFSASTMIAAFEDHCPDLLEPCRNALDSAVTDLDFLRLDPASYEECRGISLDYAVIEKSKEIKCVPLRSDWSDLGAWPSVWQIAEKDGRGNAGRGDILFQDTNESYAHSDEGICLAVVGLDNVLAVATRDAVLVASKDRSHAVRELVAELNAADRSVALHHARVHRPWGWYENLSRGDGYQVKSLLINPGASLSLQSHDHRAEHWVVVSGKVQITNGDREFRLSENQSTYIPPRNIHRLSNPTDTPAMLIEVQSGSYLGEDDIVRYEDDYGRGAKD